jgi:hypothetical protein
MKQTAVEWLEQMLLIILNKEEFKKITLAIKLAKEMEKQQIIDDVNQNEFEDEDGFGICETITKGEQYYNEIYNK